MLTASANTREHSSTDHKVGVLRGRLQSASHQCKQGARKKTVDAADPVGQPSAREAAKDGSEVVHADNASLVRLVGHRAVGQTNAHLLDIPGGGIDASHDALVIALEEDGDEGEGLDGDVELARRQPLPDCEIAHGGYLTS